MCYEEGKYVYLIGPSGGPLKIGIAKDVKSRRSILNVGNANYLRIFHIVEAESVDEAKKLENELHYHYQDCHLRGEWFDLKESDVSQIKQIFYSSQLMACAPDNWSLERKGCDEFTPEVCKIARCALSISEKELANRAQIGEATVKNFESSSTAANINTVEALKAAFEDLGVEFIREQRGKRLRILI